VDSGSCMRRLKVTTSQVGVEFAGSTLQIGWWILFSDMTLIQQSRQPD
jgi:hypothetical protein